MNMQQRFSIQYSVFLVMVFSLFLLDSVVCATERGGVFNMLYRAADTVDKVYNSRVLRECRRVAKDIKDDLVDAAKAVRNSTSKWLNAQREKINKSNQQAMEQVRQTYETEMINLMNKKYEYTSEQYAFHEKAITEKRDMALKRLEEEHKYTLAAAEKDAANWEKIQQQFIDVGRSEIAARMSEDRELKKCVMEAKTKAEAEIQMNQATLDSRERMLANIGNAAKNFFSSPKKVGYGITALAATTVAYYGARSGVQVLQKWLESKIKQPRLIIEKIIPSTFNKAMGFVPKSRKDEMVLAPSIDTQIKDITAITSLAVKDKGLLSNLLFKGPPGTGKTMCARSIGYGSGLPFIVIQGSGFTQYEAGKDIQELNSIFAWIDQMYRWYGPIIVFVDEADAFIVERTTPGLSERARNLTDAFLGLVEKPSSEKFMFIFATNHPERVDKAIHSRIDGEILFTLPTRIEILGMLKINMKKLLTNPVKKERKIIVHPEVESKLDELAQELETCTASGRDVEQCVVNFARQVLLRNAKARVLTWPLVRLVIDRFKEKKQGEAIAVV